MPSNNCHCHHTQEIKKCVHFKKNVKIDGKTTACDLTTLNVFPCSGDTIYFNSKVASSINNTTLGQIGVFKADDTTNTDMSVAIVPKGQGALQASESGNPRGPYAVDLQIATVAPIFVAEGPISSIGGGIANLNIPERTEYAVLKYTSGNSGTLNAADIAYQTTAGITVIYDTANTSSVVGFQFSSAYTHPPASISIYGQSSYANNTWVVKSLATEIVTRSIANVGGTSSAPTFFTNFGGGTTTIRLQLDKGSTGTDASPGLGNRPFCGIIFRF